MIVGKKVSLVLPGGETISGTAKIVETDALVVKVGKPDTSAICNAGMCRIPRFSLHAVQVHSKTRRYRIIGTTIGSIAGFFAGALASFAIEGGGFFGPSRNEGKAAAAAVGIIVAGVAGGYALGNAADRKTIALIIEP